MSGPGMATKDRLADALARIGLREMSAKARTGYYDDWLSPLAMPTVELMRELALVGSDEALRLRARVWNGDFDGTKEEGDAWAASPEGQAVLRKLRK